jgi:hypothetical protein
VTGLDERARRLTEELMASHLLPEPNAADLRLQVRELLRGLVIATDMSGRLLPLSVELSDVWLAVLVTPGLPEHLPDPVELVDVRVGAPGGLTDLFVEWVDRYLTTFGPLEPDVVRYWPAARFLAARGVDPTALVSPR